jgi:hypothetical protein
MYTKTKLNLIFNRHCSWTRHCEIDVFGNWPNFFLNWPNFLDVLAGNFFGTWQHWKSSLQPGTLTTFQPKAAHTAPTAPLVLQVLTNTQWKNSVSFGQWRNKLFVIVIHRFSLVKERWMLRAFVNCQKLSYRLWQCTMVLQNAFMIVNWGMKKKYIQSAQWIFTAHI